MELGDPEGEKVSVPFWCGIVGSKGSPHGGSEGKPLLSGQAPSLG